MKELHKIERSIKSFFEERDIIGVIRERYEQEKREKDYEQTIAPDIWKKQSIL